MKKFVICLCLLSVGCVKEVKETPIPVECDNMGEHIEAFIQAAVEEARVNPTITSYQMSLLEQRCVKGRVVALIRVEVIGMDELRCVHGAMVVALAVSVANGVPNYEVVVGQVLGVEEIPRGRCQAGRV